VVCLAGVPSLLHVGYADVVCIVAALAVPSTTVPIASTPSEKSMDHLNKEWSGSLPHYET
jgi:hypothetical protein